MPRVFTSGIDFIKKAILVVVVYYIVFSIFGNVINRNRPQIDDKVIIAAQQKEMYKVLDNNKLSQTKAGKISIALYRFTNCAFIGELCTDKPIADDSYFKSSLLGKMSSLIALPYQNPPASGAYWVADTLQKAGFIPASYAAEGLGYSSLKPLINIWKIFRDVSYLLIVLILVSIGFMIMFRMKLNPQTVISVENALPKIVVALLLITFSFAIAGFLIDITYLLILLSINLLSTGDVYVKVQNQLLNSNLGTLWDYILPKNGTLLDPVSRVFYLGDAFAALLPNEINNAVKILSGGAILYFVGASMVRKVEGTGLVAFLNGINIIGNGVGNLFQGIIGTIVTLVIYSSLGIMAANGLGLIFGIIVFLTFTSILFTIFFLLFRSYLQIILMIVFAPVILLLEAVPGKSTFGYWIKGLIGELITFPVVITMLLVGKMMTTTLSYPGDYWKAPFIGNLNTTGFGVIMGAGLIFLIPDIVKLVKDGLGVKPLPFNLGVGTFLGGAGVLGGGAMGILQQFSTLNMGMAAFGDQGIISKLRGKGEIPKEKAKTPAVTTGVVVPGQPT